MTVEPATILAIETSCDETAAAVVIGGREIRSNIVASQIASHRRFGGVVPEVASRHHMENIVPVVAEALEVAGLSFYELDAVAVTYGPGLVGALLVGLAYAKSLAYALDKPLIGVHHLLGHIYAGFLQYPELPLPAVCLVVSGGHTNLVYLESHTRRRILGSTRDDAAGEAFDKVARVLGLPYPGGPELEKLAREGDPRAVSFPRAWLEEGSLDFSFSGLKSAVINYLHHAQQTGAEVNPADVAASFQAAVVEVLVTKTIQAARRFNACSILLAGGVAANGFLRREMAAAAREAALPFFCPEPRLCTDNAAMIACAAYYQYLRRDFAPLDLNAIPDLPLY
ncbi:MAG: tRNA (adenosine(37)-N6)-threonylcarbamoyltransferase complex transferase subunit TsaD [Moorella humiferrea]|uniref:tRNA (adenosine(37)-N6)-threonylcarbamoyltransferase complex transferase subunit TsaD n=1 Tax=Neomoorella humiferrea TaxID=676965 RepID=UPI000D039AFA|nr:tRNA (adenosine(37)-N6)-threonylcarbamoyltransferase complex transferase subunit TsaD [Moorella humiferrea]MBE3572748.1 tRNA (adenosine(37)-N6)-threonylcarbamoyltransferase complex transferase subunit TsaD [Moorella humiferrea]